MKPLSEQVALVTGSSQGLGRGIALELARAGANLAITHLDTPADYDKAQQVVAEIDRLNVSAIAVPLDVTSQTSVDACVQQVHSHFGRVDILVNNAGVMQKGSGIEETAPADFELCHRVNVEGLWRVSQAVIPHFRAQQTGKIVNIASVAGRVGGAAVPAYSASKAAVINLTQSMAKALGPDNINVNAVCPGIIWTPMWESVESLLSKTDDQEKINEQASFTEATKNIPLKRPQHQEDIGHAVVFLCSDQAKNITGQSLNIDGGLFMS